MHEIGFGKASIDVAAGPVDPGDDVALRIENAGFRALVVQDRRVRPHRLFGIEDRGQQIVFDAQPAAPLLRRRLAFGHHRGDALADKANHVVEHAGVVGIVVADLVPAGREQFRAARPRGSAPQRTPGTCIAAVRSMARMRACGCGERRIFRCRSPSGATSVV